MTHENRADHIKDILSRRRPLADRINRTAVHFSKLNGDLDSLMRLCEVIKESISDNSHISELVELISHIDLLQTHLVKRQSEIEKLASRFQRETLTIGVVGRARQGKSRFLQSITGLTADVIPDGSGSHCTGVKSIISHKDGNFHAKVYVYNEYKFLTNVIAPYYERLNLGEPPKSLDGFASGFSGISLPVELTSATEKSMFEHLAGYHENLSEYRALIESAEPITLDKESKVRQYIAQDDVKGKRVFYKYMAVERVEIQCCFPNPEVGQISLVDLPGLGDTGIGDQERLLGTIATDVDLVAFVRMPKPSGDFWADVDVDLYDIAESALGDTLPLKHWSFMVLNQTSEGSKNGDNSMNLNQMLEDLGKKHIKVVDALKANCGNMQESNKNALDPMLNYLSRKIVRLDQQFVENRQQDVFDTYARIDDVITRAKELTSLMFDSTTPNGLFVGLFRDVWRNITTELQHLVDELRVQCDQCDQDYKQMVSEVIDLANQNKHIPSLNEVTTERAGHDGFRPAYDHLLTQMRVRLSRHFKRIYTSIARIVEKRKQQIRVIFDEYGRFSHLFHGSIAAPNEYFLEVANLMEEQEPRFQYGLAEAFRLLAEFQYSRSAVLHRLRMSLSRFDPDSSEKIELESLTSDEIVKLLDKAYVETVKELETTLKKFAYEPNQAAYAMTAEFVDRIIRATDAEDDWRIIYQNFAQEVWPDEFDEVNSRSAQRQEWLALLSQLSSEGERDNFVFIQP